MALSKKTALWIAAESTYGTDPDSDGSDYKFVPALVVPRPVDEKRVLATDYATGRQYATAPISGADGWSLPGLEIPLIGLLTAADDGSPASGVADDWLDIFLESIFGNQDTTAGEGVASTSNTNLTVDSAAYAIQDLIPVYESGLPSTGRTRSQWALATVDNTGGSYTVAPQWASNPTGAAVAYGAKIYRPTDEGGSSLALAVEDDDLIYTCLGGRINAFSIVGELGQILRARMSISGDTKTEGGKASKPARLAAPAITPVKALLSPLWFNGTAYETSRFEFDLGLETAEIGSTAATNGRADSQLVTMRPRLTVSLLRTDALNNLKRNQTTGRVLLQLGAGVLSGGVLNTLCVHMEEATAREVTNVDELGIARQQIVFEASDKVYFSGTTLAQFVQFARA